MWLLVRAQNATITTYTINFRIDYLYGLGVELFRASLLIVFGCNNLVQQLAPWRTAQ